MDAQGLAVRDLFISSRSLLIYAKVLATGPGAVWQDLLGAIELGDADRTLGLYGQWFHQLASQSQGWQDHVLAQLLTADNAFTDQVQRRDWDDLPSALRLAVQHDLQILQQIYQCDCEQIAQWVKAVTRQTHTVAWVDRLMPVGVTADVVAGVTVGLPVGVAGGITAGLRSPLAPFVDWSDAIPALIDHYRQFGTGLFGQFQAFRWEKGELVGIANPDPIQLDRLVGYEWQRQALIQNTQALLAGFTALNVLLYGSRGSGKSSLIKALLHEFGDAGLRLIEVAKSHLIDLPNIVDRLRGLPQKFVIFVDDLSFEEDEAAFKALKVVLEGGLTARPVNVVVYATSNRRHLIREFHGDRPRPKDADEIHQWDTVQEKLSFSDRFGLTLTFEPADQPTYLQIIQHLAAAADLAIDPADLEFRALQWATQHNGRSGRSARQFIDYLSAELRLK
jgi:uncharacterized protein